MKKLYSLLLIICIFFTFTYCRNYPKNHNEIVSIIYNSIIENDFRKIWNIYSNNPSVRKDILISLYRLGKITKKVLQKDMGRIFHFKEFEKKKLKNDFNRIIEIKNKLKISNLIKSTKIDTAKKILNITIGKSNNQITLNVHYDIIDNKYYLISIYSTS